MGGQESKEEKSATINENIKIENNNGGNQLNQQNMDFSATIKFDTVFIICIALIVFLVYKINKSTTTVVKV